MERKGKGGREGNTFSHHEYLIKYALIPVRQWDQEIFFPHVSSWKSTPPWLELCKRLNVINVLNIDIPINLGSQA